MASVNKVILVGNLGQDPEVRYAPNSNYAIANVRLATKSVWNDKSSGDRREETEWHRVVFYGRQAEVVEQYLKKGSQIYVEGRIKTRKWTDKEGQDRYTTEIIADQMQMLGGRQADEVTTFEPKTGSGSEGQGDENIPDWAKDKNGATAQTKTPQPPKPLKPAVKPPKPEPIEDFDDDIPF